MGTQPGAPILGDRGSRCYLLRRPTGTALKQSWVFGPQRGRADCAPCLLPPRCRGACASRVARHARSASRLSVRARDTTSPPPPGFFARARSAIRWVVPVGFAIEGHRALAQAPALLPPPRDRTRSVSALGRLPLGYGEASQGAKSRQIGPPQ